MNDAQSPPRELQIEVANSISRVAPEDWNRLDFGDFVFADHRFLKSLEDSGSLGRRTGWHPAYLLAREGGDLVGAVPLFAKTNSYGEFIFDWAWANAAHLAGEEYYPKLLSAIPFTPATGPKFLFSPTANRAFVREALLKEAEKRVEITQSSSLHFLFITQEEAAVLRAHEFSIRHSYQYHWKNEGWKSFDDFLRSLRSKRRSEIRRERAGAARHGLEFRILTGADLKEEHAEIMSKLYRSTVGKMGGAAYLTPDFFKLVFERMPEHIVLMLAFDGGQPVAGALNFTNGKMMYGRYWGCLEEYRHLHFELCYYQAIDWALQNGIEIFEAGAQGEHKFNRGFRPELMLSAHRLESESLHRAVHEFIEEEKLAIAELMSDYKAHDPYQRLAPEPSKDKEREL